MMPILATLTIGRSKPRPPLPVSFVVIALMGLASSAEGQRLSETTDVWPAI